MIRGVAPLNAIGLLILGGSCMLLLKLTAQEIRQDDVVAPAKVEWTPKLSISAGPVADAAPLSAYRQTTERPLFFKTRQPFVPLPHPPPRLAPAVAKSAPPPPPPADPGLAVGGVIITGQAKKAYLFNKTDRTGSWLVEGEEITGWKVKSIDSAGAMLTKDGRDVELPLYTQSR